MTSASHLSDVSALIRPARQRSPQPHEPNAPAPKERPREERGRRIGRREASPETHAEPRLDPPRVAGPHSSWWGIGGWSRIGATERVFLAWDNEAARRSSYSRTRDHRVETAIHAQTGKRGQKTRHFRFRRRHRLQLLSINPPKHHASMGISRPVFPKAGKERMKKKGPNQSSVLHYQRETPRHKKIGGQIIHGLTWSAFGGAPPTPHPGT